METYINGMSCISHFNTIDENFYYDDVQLTPEQKFLNVTAPDYKNYIPVNTLRRTSQILKMGISAGMICLQRAGLKTPDAIITGTGIGCFEDTDKFLMSIAENKEKMLTPTPFIQSTHNTVGGQIALLTKCQGYNFTYVHQNVSFESALLDAMMLLEEKEADNILIGGLDELNTPLKEMFERAGYIKNSEQGSEKGYVAGEGAAFFSLSSKQSEQSQAIIKGTQIIQKLVSEKDLYDRSNTFLNDLGLKSENISLVLSGLCGDETMDEKLHGFDGLLAKPALPFKKLCGEFFTSSAFALWFAASILKKQQIPKIIAPDNFAVKTFDHILIVNHYHGQQYSLMCVGRC